MSSDIANGAKNEDARLIQVQVLLRAFFIENLSLPPDQRQHCHFNVYVQAPNAEDNETWRGKTIFLTVHDIGDTPEAFIEFVRHPSMAAVREKSVFLHVCVPGQEDGAADIVGDFPSMDQMGENLAHVLDSLDVRYCIGLGEGAGADILCRFAMRWPKRVLGLALIHCMDTAHGIIDSFKEMLASLRLEDGKMNDAAWDYLFTHKYGNYDLAHRSPIMVGISLRQNVHNLSRYLYAFSQRSDICKEIGNTLDKTEILLATGAKTTHKENVYQMYENMISDREDRNRVTLLVIDNTNDLLMDEPERFANALILFCKGFGELSGVPVPGLTRQMSPSASMEVADRPSGRYSRPSSPIGQKNE